MLLFEKLAHSMITPLKIGIKNSVEEQENSVPVNISVHFISEGVVMKQGILVAVG